MPNPKMFWSPYGQVLDISKRKIVYVDLDDTTADFYKAAKSDYGTVEECRMYEKEFFFNLQPVPGALKAVRKLMRLGFDVWILTQPLYDSFWCYEEKARWIYQWFPDLAQKVIFTQHKGLHVGHYLIDDNARKWKGGFEKNGGKFVHFEYQKSDNSLNENKWEEIVQFFNNEDPEL